MDVADRCYQSAKEEIDKAKEEARSLRLANVGPIISNDGKCGLMVFPVGKIPDETPRSTEVAPAPSSRPGGCRQGCSGEGNERAATK